MPESMVHLLVRTFLFQLLRHALGPGHSIGSEQFVYWMPTNPRRNLAPDVFVKRGVPQTLFGTWKCWQSGAPDLAVEIVSPSDSEGLAWDEKVARYAELGITELLRFDPEAPEGERMRDAGLEVGRAARGCRRCGAPPRGREWRSRPHASRGGCA
jgi:Uma2 family endonuclease